MDELDSLSPQQTDLPTSSISHETVDPIVSALITRIVEETHQYLVVEVGSETIPVAFFSRRGIKPGEHFVCVNTTYPNEKLADGKTQYSVAALLADKYKDEENFSSIEADATKMPFPDSSVNELIFNNVFGSYYDDPEMMAAFLKEASRVLIAKGEIHITEMNTPNFIPNEWFVGGRPDRNNSMPVKANADYFQQFGLQVKSLSTEEEDIREYREPFYGRKGFYPIAFTLTLEKEKMAE